MLAFTGQGLFAQAVLRGKVIGDENKKPLASASVYLNNTSLGTTSNEQGSFFIGNIPAGKFNLIVSCVGYETYTVLIDPHQIPKELIISLKTKSDELKSFSVTPPEPDGWKIWGALFTELFIGTTPHSNDCKLMNHEVIKFRKNPDNTLTAYANEPLQIMNYNLGYEVKYKLQDFQYDLVTKRINYSGYAFFTDMGKKHSNRVRRYTKARFEDYKGSLLHFKRAFYANQLDAQGFEMRNLGNIPNFEKLRAKRLFALHRDSVILDTTGLSFTVHINYKREPYISSSTEKTEDSADYFKKKLREPDSVISHEIVSADSIGFAADSTIAGLFFKDSLEVSYKYKSIPNRYRALSKDHKHEEYPVSQFVFINQRPVYILKNGFLYKTEDLKVTGYWAWWETMATLLPYDYMPKNE
ncbi:MAG TPA: carboxypeptidase-like regulatory domain-containing protein [Puia sp.]